MKFMMNLKLSETWLQFGKHTIPPAGIETPLTRKINTMDIEDGKQFRDYLNKNAEEKAAVENLYKLVNNTHSHIISGPNRATFRKLIKELEKNEEILGINLTKKEVAEITRKNIK